MPPAVDFPAGCGARQLLYMPARVATYFFGPVFTGILCPERRHESCVASQVSKTAVPAANPIHADVARRNFAARR